MSLDILVIALLAGAANWGFRYLPLRLGGAGGLGDGVVARFLAAAGPAAICTLFVASVLPALMELPDGALALTAGVGAVVAVYLASKSVAAATFAGAIAYGLAVWVTG